MNKPMLWWHQGSAIAHHVQAADKAFCYLWHLSARKLYGLYVHNVSHTHSELKLSRTRTEVLLAGGEADPVKFPFIEEMQPQSVSQPASQISWREIFAEAMLSQSLSHHPTSRVEKFLLQLCSHLQLS